MAMNALQLALVNAGLAEEPKPRKQKTKQFKCFKCHTVMTKIPDSNIMVCDKCGQYFIFDRNK